MISVIIPAYNEERAIGGVIAELKHVLPATGSDAPEIIVVDDGSIDATSARAKEAGATAVIRHPHNVGYGRALKAGIAAARHDVVIITDGDSSYPIAEVPRLLARFNEGFDMVVAARQGQHYRESAMKVPLRALLTFLVEFTAGRKVPDVNSGLRIFRKSTVTPYLPHLSNTFSFTTSLTLVYMLTGRFVAYEPVEYRPRIGETNVRLVRDSLRTLQYIVHAITVYNPIKAFLLLALGCLLVAAGCFILAAFGRFGAFAAGVQSVLVAVLMIGLGLIADLIRRPEEQ
jgi:glycosyltransferase involved in cell wall biosynthesis